jgi:hypothetical protein
MVIAVGTATGVDMAMVVPATAVVTVGAITAVQWEAASEVVAIMALLLAEGSMVVAAEVASTVVAEVASMVAAVDMVAAVTGKSSSIWPKKKRLRVLLPQPLLSVLLFVLLFVSNS